MPRQRTHYNRRAYVFPDDFPQRPVWFKHASRRPWAEIALVMLVFPEVVAPPEGTKTYTLRERPAGVLIPFGAGVYGGFAQAGVGFILVAALAAGLRYDLVRANALKVVCTALFSAASLSVFILTGRVKWVSASILAVGKTAGAYLGVKLAVVVNQMRITWMFFVKVCLTSTSALLFS